jgi:hypothetical protein
MKHLELEWFKKISGLKINFSKTQVIWIGSKKYSSDKYSFILLDRKQMVW